MKNILALVCVVTAASAVSFTRVVYEEWKEFKLMHHKRYDNELEDQYRMKVYAENKRKIAKHNQLFVRGRASFSQRLNKYSDLTHREFVTYMNGYNRTRTNSAATDGRQLRGAKYEPPANWEPPKELNWSKEGAVTQVKDQRMCASCWAFSATGALEGQHFRHTGRLVSLSEQNLIDCTMDYDNYGCRGGKMDNAFVYIGYNQGIDTETSYPYEAMDDSCRYNPHTAGAADIGYATVEESEWAVMQAVASVGPVAAAMCGSLDSFRHYMSGVYHDKKCTANRGRHHAVLIVGYGKDEKEGDYWLIKNSWGTSWGMDGYAKIARNQNNLCGIASEVSYPLV